MLDTEKLNGTLKAATRVLGDSPLLPQSYTEMALVGKYLNPVKFKHIYASPIKRTRITAEHIKAELNNNVPLSLDNRLEEFKLGKMEGMKFEEAKKQFPETFDNFRNHPDLYDPSEIGRNLSRIN